LEQAFELALHGAVLGAVRDGPQWIKLERKVKEFRDMGLPNAPYFNAGVLLVDCKAWLERGSYERLLEIAQEKPDVLAKHDQSLLNLAFYQDWVEISPVWNWQANSKMNLWGEYFGARLVHTVDGRTVWKDVSGRLPRRYTSEFRLYCEKVGLDCPNTLEDHRKLYRRFLTSIFLQVKGVFVIPKITQRFPQDDVTIRHKKSN
jgi:lipopolysaccharide biosynthesis glycosyltransferase